MQLFLELSGFVDLTINSSQVNLPFTYTVSCAVTAQTDIDDVKLIGYSLNGNNSTMTPINTSPASITNTVLASANSASIRIYVQWVDEISGQSSLETLDDDDDTQVAIDEGIAEVTVSVSFTQAN